MSQQPKSLWQRFLDWCVFNGECEHGRKWTEYCGYCRTDHLVQ